MKKIVLIIIIAFSSYSAKSQTLYGFCADCYASIEAGMVSANVSGFPDGTAKPGFYVGIYIYNWLNDSFSYRLGASYQTLGAKVNDRGTNLIIHYASIPLSLHYTYDNKFQVFTGGALGINMFGKFPSDEGVVDNFFDPEFAFTDNISVLDASAFLGAGIILSEEIDINLKYNLGLTDIRSEEIRTNPGEQWNNNWITLSVGYTFRK